MAATRDFIKIDRTNTTATHAGLLLQYVTAVRQAFELGQKVKGIMDHNNDGTVYTDAEALFGIPTGQGATIDAITSAVFTPATAKALTERVG